jgi:hypothetical protein
VIGENGAGHGTALAGYGDRKRPTPPVDRRDSKEGACGVEAKA